MTTFIKKITLFCCLMSCVFAGYSEVDAPQVVERVSCFFPKNEFGNPLMIDRKTLEIGYAIPRGSILWRNRNKKWMFVIQGRDKDAYAQSFPVPKGAEAKINYALFPDDFSMPEDFQVQEITGPDGTRVFKILYKDKLPCEIIIYSKSGGNKETFEMLYPLPSETISKIKLGGHVLLDLARPLGAYIFYLVKDLRCAYSDQAQLFKFNNGMRVKIIYRYGWPYEIVGYVDDVEQLKIAIPSLIVDLVKQNEEAIFEIKNNDVTVQAVLRKYPKSQVCVVTSGA